MDLVSYSAAISNLPCNRARKTKIMRLSEYDLHVSICQVSVSAVARSFTKPQVIFILGPSQVFSRSLIAVQKMLRWTAPR